MATIYFNKQYLVLHLNNFSRKLVNILNAIVLAENSDTTMKEECFKFPFEWNFNNWQEKRDIDPTIGHSVLEYFSPSFKPPAVITERNSVLLGLQETGHAQSQVSTITIIIHMYVYSFCTRIRETLTIAFRYHVIVVQEFYQQIGFWKRRSKNGE